MRCRPPSNIADSVHARLLNRSRETGEEFQFLLQRYAAERFLYRLGECPERDRYVLKGAMLFALWGGSLYRATRDLDFTGYGSSGAELVLAAMRAICSVPVADDGMAFDGGTLAAEPIREDTEYHGLRVRFRASLGNARIPMQIDIGFGNAIEPPATTIDYPTLLDSPVPRVLAYPQEAVVAEKLHALVVLGERSTRYKDLYDLHVLAHEFPFEGGQLARAITATFERRGTLITSGLPAALAPRFYADGGRGEQWRAYLRRSALPGAPPDLAAVGELLQAFLGVPWGVLATGLPFVGHWAPNGPWNTPTAEEPLP